MTNESVEIRDSNGSLCDFKYKIFPERSAVSYKFDDKRDMRTLILSPDNIAYDRIQSPRENHTYKQVLQYNGTLNSTDRIFQQILVDETSSVGTLAAPEIRYTPTMVKGFDSEEMSNYVTDLMIHEDLCVSLNYKQGDLTRGGKTYRTVPTYLYPAEIRKWPNTENDTVYLDGWYTYTFINFIDVEAGDVINDGTYFGYAGNVYKAKVEFLGEAVILLANKGVYIVPRVIYNEYVGGLIDIAAIHLRGIEVHENIIDNDTATWEDLRANLQAYDGIGGTYHASFLDTQILITDELMDATVHEVLCASANGVKTLCDVEDWQTLSMKRKAALVMFENGLYRNAQVIIESTRKMCNAKIEHGCWI